MLLVIDAGNTNIVAGAYRGDDILVGPWRRETGRDRTSAELFAWLEACFAGAGLSVREVRAAAVASVVPALDGVLERTCADHLRVKPVVVGRAYVRLGIAVRVDKPEEVGADRLANAVAAHARYGGPLLVVDFGTATTFDVVDRDGAYCGGALAPGVNLSVEAVHRATAKLPRIAVERPPAVIGRATVSAMQSGVYWGYVSMIEGMVARIRAEFGVPDMKVVATGGLASLFLDATGVIDVSDPDLTLYGLKVIAERNGVTS
jgi:type III pantothenate kinase